jgi:hypothetical protein
MNDPTTPTNDVTLATNLATTRAAADGSRPTHGGGSPRSPRRRAVGVLSSLLAMALVAPMAEVGAAGPPPMVDESVFGSTVIERVGEVARRSMQRSPRSAPRTDRTTQVERPVVTSRAGECVEDLASDTRGDVVALDISGYGVSSDCDVWAFAAVTVDEWSLWELDGLVVALDLDERAGTGCNGWDAAAAAIHDGGLFAGMYLTPTCEEDTWTFLGAIPASSRYTNSIALGFPGDAIGGDRSFRWTMALGSIYARPDRAPDTGWRQVGAEAAPAPASAPRAVTASAAPRTLTMSWRPPLSDGGSRITDYAVQIRSGSSGWSTVSDGVGSRRSATIGRLVNGRRYDVRVAAVTAAGRGAWSRPVAATPVGTPSSVRRLDARPRARAALVTWSRPADNGGRPIVDYVIQVSTSGGRSWTTVADGRSRDTTALVEDLRAGRRHLVRVAARNDVGRGRWSAPVAVTPRGR